jgi:very-short-patch-repair endonuclease
VDPQQVAPLLAALKQAWPALELKGQRQSSLVSLAHAFAMIGISNVDLWRLMLTDLIGIKKAANRLMDGNIAAFAMKKSGIICETLTPGVYADLAPLWKEISELYRMKDGYLQRGELESALSRRVSRAVASLQVNAQKTGVIDEVFTYDILIDKMNVEIDGPAHFIRWTNGKISRNQHWNHRVRDRVLERKGYQIARIAYWDLADLTQQELTEKLASILNIKI